MDKEKASDQMNGAGMGKRIAKMALLAIITLVLLFLMRAHYGSEVSRNHETIVILRKQIEERQPIVANLRTEHASLVNTFVTEYAANQNMVDPEPGQLIVMNVPSHMNQNQMVARHESGRPVPPVGLATITTGKR